MNEEDDTNIRVNIRTGTSTRRANPRPERIQRSDIYDFLLRILNEDIGMSSVINNSMNDGELERDDYIQLDIENREYTDSDQGKKCTICFEDISRGDRVTTLDNCNHTFHHNCISLWGKYKQDCPVCRQPIDYFNDLEIE